jgi:hypothetical protein
MRVVLFGILAVTIVLPIRDAIAQATPRTATTAPVAAQSAAPVVPVSTQLQPALSAVLRTVDSLRIDKWKRGNIRDEAAQNVSQIQRDIDVTLPPMLRDADTAPANLSKLLPISKNLSALYDVLLRVTEASRVVAPDDQVVELQHVLLTLADARLALGERMQAAAVAMEKQVTDLRTTVQTQEAKIAATPVPVAVPCKPAEPRKTTKRTTTHRHTTKTTTAKPSAGTQSKPNSSTQTH